jgi:hypothetical protein
MPKPTVKQQERARTRIRQLITSKPTTKTRTEEKIRLGRKLGYSGKNKNIARSVDRLIMRNRDSSSARNLSDVKQVRAIDRAWYSRTRNIDFILERNQWRSLSVLPYVPAILTYDDFIDNDRNVWTTTDVPRVLFRDKTGVVFGDIYVILIVGGQTLSNERWIHSQYLAKIPLAATFGYLENKNDLYYLFNQRIEILFQRAGDSITNAIIFKESELTPEEKSTLTRPLSLFIGDYLPGRRDDREMV